MEGKNYQVIRRGGVTVDTFSAGSKEQAEAYWRLMYDYEFTKLEELVLDDLNDIRVDTDGEYVFIYRNDKCIISAQLIEWSESFIQLDENGNDMGVGDITNDLMQFPAFRSLCICDKCMNHGYYESYEGDKHIVVECQCDGVEWHLDHLMPVK